MAGDGERERRGARYRVRDVCPHLTDHVASGRPCPRCPRHVCKRQRDLVRGGRAVEQSHGEARGALAVRAELAGPRFQRGAADEVEVKVAAKVNPPDRVVVDDGRGVRDL